MAEKFWSDQQVLSDGMNNPGLIKMRRGEVPGREWVEVNAHSDTIGTTVQNISEVAEIFYPTVATQLAAASTSTNDVDTSGTGAHTIRVTGLDTNLDLITETITLNGQTETAATTASFLRVLEVKVMTAGSGNANDGKIEIAASSDTATLGEFTQPFATVRAGANVSADGTYTIRNNQTGYIMDLVLAAESNKDATLTFEYREPGGSIWYRQLEQHSAAGGGTPVKLWDGGLPAGTDIRTRASVSSGTASATSIVHLVLVDET